MYYHIAIGKLFLSSNIEPSEAVSPDLVPHFFSLQVTSPEATDKLLMTAPWPFV